MRTKTLEQKDKRFHESFFKQILNSILVGILIGLSYLPFGILFGISDIFYVLLRYIVKYRNKVIIENLSFAFPEKTKLEIKLIRNKFYYHLCDVFVENIKIYSLNSNAAKRRIKIKGADEMNAYFDKGTSVIMLGMHYNNWEWSSFLPSELKHKNLVIYNPSRGNHAFEKFLLHSREKWGSTFVPVHKSTRTVLEFNKKEIPTALGLGADQAAPATSKFWTMFLNREAPFFSGPEKIAKRTNQPIFFHHTRKIKRGHYEIELFPLIENPKDIESKDILLIYIRKMEEIINEKPEFYLWSHRRWKHTRPEGIPLTL